MVAFAGRERRTVVRASAVHGPALRIGTVLRTGAALRIGFGAVLCIGTVLFWLHDLFVAEG